MSLCFALLACSDKQQCSSAFIQAEVLQLTESQIIGGKVAPDLKGRSSGIVGLVIFKQLTSQAAALARKQGENINNQNIIQAICTGSILSDQLILTAAHCAFDEPGEKLLQILAVFGNDMKKIANSPELIKSHVRHVTALRISPIYSIRRNLSINNADVALFKFAGGLPVGFNPVPFAPNMAAVKAGGQVVISGYGVTGMKPVLGTDGRPLLDPNGEIIYEPTDKDSTGILRYTNVQVAGGLMADPNTDRVTVSTSTATHEIAVDQRQNRGACHGDSGGPAYVYVNGKLNLWGITSRGDNSCATFGIYTNALMYADWIRRASAELLAIPTHATNKAAAVAAAGKARITFKR